MSDADTQSAADSSSSGSGSSGLTSVFRAVVPDFVRRSFALKFVIVLLVMGLAIGGIGALATAQITDETGDRVRAEYSNLARQEGDIVEQWVERNRLSTRLTSNNDVWATGDTEQMAVTAKTKRSDLPSDVTNIHVFNRSGGSQRIVASTSLATGTDLDTLDSREWLLGTQFDRANQVVMSDVYRVDGEPVVGFASPIGATQNRYLVMEVSVVDIARSLRGSDRAEGGYTQVVNENNVVVIDEKATGATDGESEILSEYASGEARRPVRKAFALEANTTTAAGVVARMDANSQVMDEAYAVGYAPIDNAPWVILVHAPTAEVFGFVSQVNRWGIFATVAAVLTTGLVGALVGYNTATSIDRLTSKAEEMEEGNLDVDIETDRIDNVGRLYDGFASMRDALQEQIQEAQRARKEAEVSRAEAMEMNEYLQETAEEYSEIMGACAKGDLTRRMEPEGENEAMDQIARDFNDMIEELEMTTGQLKTFAREVGEAGTEVQESAETVRDASEQVADSIQMISDDAYDQKERLQTISEEIDGVADSLSAFADQHPEVDVSDSLDRIREVAAMIDETAGLAEDTMAESENVAGAAEEQAAELNEVSEQAEELTRKSQYLDDGLNRFETEEEHEFVFQTGAPGIGGGLEDGPDGDGADADGDGA